MSAQLEEVPDAAPRPVDLLALAADAHARSEAAALEVFEMAALWADAHPALDDRPESVWEVPQPGEPPRLTCEQVVALSEWDPSLLDESGNLAWDVDEDAFGWASIPAVAWDAPAAFAAAIGCSTGAAKAMIRDALVLRHRLPLTWARVTSGRVPVWRGRRIAQVVLGSPADVVEAVDAAVAEVAGTITPAQLAGLLEAEMIRLHAELRELEQLEALEQRSVRLCLDGIGHTGIADLTIRGDWADVSDLHDVLTRLAHALGDPDLVALVGCTATGCEREVSQTPLDVRRTIAAGILADPARTRLLLDALPQDEEGSEPLKPRRRVELVVHLTDHTLAGFDTITRCEGPTGLSGIGPVLAQVVTQWLGRTDTHIKVRPVLDLTTALDHTPHPAHTERSRSGGSPPEPGYRPPPWLDETVKLLHPTCVHPYCGKPARVCDLDHTKAHPDGPTCACNLAPLCRHHHNLKTHTAWTYQPIDPLLGIYHWTSPHGLTFRVDHTGTHPLTD